MEIEEDLALSDDRQPGVPDARRRTAAAPPAQGHEPPPPAQDAAPTETAPPEHAEKGALFRALVDAGAEAMVAYTANQHIRTMTAGTVATQLQPFLVEMRRMFADHERRVDERFAEQNRKLDVLTARVDGLKVLVHVMLGALALLVTALIAVFGLLFTT